VTPPPNSRGAASASPHPTAHQSTCDVAVRLLRPAATSSATTTARNWCTHPSSVASQRPARPIPLGDPRGRQNAATSQTTRPDPQPHSRTTPPACSPIRPSQPMTHHRTTCARAPSRRGAGRRTALDQLLDVVDGSGPMGTAPADPRIHRLAEHSLGVTSRDCSVRGAHPQPGRESPAPRARAAVPGRPGVLALPGRNQGEACPPGSNRHRPRRHSSATVTRSGSTGRSPIGIHGRPAESTTRTPPARSAIRTTPSCSIDWTAPGVAGGANSTQTPRGSPSASFVTAASKACPGSDRHRQPNTRLGASTGAPNAPSKSRADSGPPGARRIETYSLTDPVRRRDPTSGDGGSRRPANHRDRPPSRPRQLPSGPGARNTASRPGSGCAPPEHPTAQRSAVPGVIRTRPDGSLDASPCRGPGGHAAGAAPEVSS